MQSVELSKFEKYVLDLGHTLQMYYKILPQFELIW